MPLASRLVLLKQECREESQKQQDNYDQQNLAKFVITVGHERHTRR